MDFSYRHCSLQVLFVGQDDKDCLLQLFFFQHRDQLLLRNTNSILVTRIHDVNDGISGRVVTSPVGSDTGLSSQIPNLKFEVLICHLFDIETDSCEIKECQLKNSRQLGISFKHNLLGIVVTTSPT